MQHKTKTKYIQHLHLMEHLIMEHLHLNTITNFNTEMWIYVKKKKKIWPLSSLPPSPTIFHLTIQFYKDRNIPSTCQVCLASVLFLFSLCCCPPGKLFILEIQVSFVNNQGCAYLRYLKYLTTSLKF